MIYKINKMIYKINKMIYKINKMIYKINKMTGGGCGRKFTIFSQYSLQFSRCEPISAGFPLGIAFFNIVFLSKNKEIE